MIVACNTASSYAIEALRESFDIPVIGVIKPGVELAVKTTKTAELVL